MLPLAIRYASEHRAAVRRACHEGAGPLLGSALFRAIVEGRSGVPLSRHEFDDTWSLLKTPDRRVHLAVPEMLEELRALESEPPPSRSVDYSFLLMAGERRTYNANQIYRDAAWRGIDHHGAMRMHPTDAGAPGLEDGAAAHSLDGETRRRSEIVVVRAFLADPQEHLSNLRRHAAFGAGVTEQAGEVARHRRVLEWRYRKHAEVTTTLEPDAPQEAIRQPLATAGPCWGDEITVTSRS